MITSLQIAWAAGIYEGEGSCGWTGRHKNCQEAIIVQKDRWLLEKFVELFGGRISTHGSCSKWKVTGPTARGFLMTVYTFLSPRRKEQVKACGVFNRFDGILNRRPGGQK